MVSPIERFHCILSPVPHTYAAGVVRSSKDELWSPVVPRADVGYVGLSFHEHFSTGEGRGHTEQGRASVTHRLLLVSLPTQGIGQDLGSTNTLSIRQAGHLGRKK